MTKTISTLNSLIEAKKFDWVSPDITEANFPAPKEIGTNFKLFHFDKYILSEDAMKEMEKDGYRPATIYELLSWKDWNEKVSVIALSSVGKGRSDRDVPVLSGHGSERGLGLFRWYGAWNADCRFLGVRNRHI